MRPNLGNFWLYLAFSIGDGVVCVNGFDSPTDVSQVLKLRYQSAHIRDAQENGVYIAPTDT